MSMLRNDTPKGIGGFAVVRFDDYVAGTSVDKTTGNKTVLTLPKSDVLTFLLEGGASVIIRPSGTEPKIKAYYTTTGTTKDEAAELEIKISVDFQKILGF